MNIINLTPHALKIKKANGEFVTIEPSGIIARVSSSKTEMCQIEGISVFKEVLGNVENLPEPQENNFFVVSRLVASAVKRDDLLVPGNLIRDEKGNPVAAEGFAKL